MLVAKNSIEKMKASIGIDAKHRRPARTRAFSPVQPWVDQRLSESEEDRETDTSVFCEFCWGRDAKEDGEENRRKRDEREKRK